MNLKQNFNSAKKIVEANTTKILAGALVVTTTGVVLQRIGVKQHDNFLKEEGLYDKFYELNEYENLEP